MNTHVRGRSNSITEGNDAHLARRTLRRGSVLPSLPVHPHAGTRETADVGRPAAVSVPSHRHPCPEPRRRLSVRRASLNMLASPAADLPISPYPQFGATTAAHSHPSGTVGRSQELPDALNSLLDPGSPRLSMPMPTGHLAAPADANASSRRKLSMSRSQVPPLPSHAPSHLSDASSRAPSSFSYPLPPSSVILPSSSAAAEGQLSRRSSLVTNETVINATVSPRGDRRRFSPRTRNTLLSRRDFTVLGARENFPDEGDSFGRERTVSMTEALAIYPEDEPDSERRMLETPVPASAPVSRRSSMEGGRLRALRLRYSTSRALSPTSGNTMALKHGTKSQGDTTPSQVPKRSPMLRAFGRMSHTAAPSYDAVCSNVLPPRRFSVFQQREEKPVEAETSGAPEVAQSSELESKSAELGARERRSSRDRSSVLFPSKTVAGVDLTAASDEVSSPRRRRSRSRKGGKRRSKMSIVTSSLLHPGKFLSRRSSRSGSRPSSRKASIDKGQLDTMSGVSGNELYIVNELSSRNPERSEAQRNSRELHETTLTADKLDNSDLVAPLSPTVSKSESEEAAGGTSRLPTRTPSSSDELDSVSGMKSPREGGLLVPKSMKQERRSVSRSLLPGASKRRSSDKMKKKTSPRSSKSMTNVAGKGKRVTSMLEGHSRKPSAATKGSPREATPKHTPRFPLPPPRLKHPIRLAEVEAERFLREQEAERQQRQLEESQAGAKLDDNGRGTSPSALSNVLSDISLTPHPELPEDEQKSGTAVFTSRRRSSSRSISKHSTSSGSTRRGSSSFNSASDAGKRSRKPSASSFLELPEDDKVQPHKRRTFSGVLASLSRSQSSLRHDLEHPRTSDPTSQSTKDSSGNQAHGSESRFKPLRSSLWRRRRVDAQKRKGEDTGSKKNSKTRTSLAAKIRSLSRPGSPKRRSRSLSRPRKRESRKTLSKERGVRGSMRNLYRKSVSVRPPPPNFSEGGDSRSDDKRVPSKSASTGTPAADATAEDDVLASLSPTPRNASNFAALAGNASLSPVKPTPHIEKRRSLSVDAIDFWAMLGEEQIITEENKERFIDSLLDGPPPSGGAANKKTAKKKK